MEFTVATSDFSHAVQTLTPFVSAYPLDAAREVVLEIQGGMGTLIAERAGHRLASPFAVAGIASNGSVVIPFRIASGVRDIHRNFASTTNRPNAAMRIGERDGGPVFAYEACGASCEVAGRSPSPSQVPRTATQELLGDVEPIALTRALTVIADVLEVKHLDSSKKTISFVGARDRGDAAAAVAATDHELVVVQGAGILGGAHVHLSTVPLLLDFLRGADGRVTVAACDTHVSFTDSSGQTFSFPQPIGGRHYGAAPIAPNATTDVRVDVEPLVKALGFLAGESHDYPARATLATDGTLALHVREGQKRAEIEICTSFVSQARDLSFRFKPASLLRLFRSYDNKTIDLRLSIGPSKDGDAVRLLSATETTSDGSLRIHRVATLML